MPDWCLSSALAFPSDLGARRPCRGLRGWGCAHCQSLPREELFPRERKRPRLHSQAGASPPRLYLYRIKDQVLRGVCSFVYLLWEEDTSRVFFLEMGIPPIAQSCCPYNFWRMIWQPIYIKGQDYWGPAQVGGEGNGTPLQYFCLENPMDGGAWWAAVHGVARVGHD